MAQHGSSQDATGVGHERHVTGGGRQGARTLQLREVNTLLGNLKTSMASTLHSFKHAKYGVRNLAEFAYSFNRRFDMPAMIPMVTARCRTDQASAAAKIVLV